MAASDKFILPIQRLEVALPVSPGSLNAYLVPLRNSAWILIDCGMSSPPALPGPISQIIVTHAHPDHCGAAAKLRTATGAPIRMHRLESEVLAALNEPEKWLAAEDAVLSQSGVPAVARQKIRAHSLMMRRAFGGCTADEWIEDGDLIETALGPMIAIHTPGHAAGHLCFHFPERKLLITGDQLVEHHAPYIEYEPGSLERYRQSLLRLAGLDIDWVLPAHGLPFQHHRRHIQALLVHCQRKMQSVRAAKARTGKSPHDLAIALWGPPPNPFQLRCAVLEVLAYCEE